MNQDSESSGFRAYVLAMKQNDQEGTNRQNTVFQVYSRYTEGIPRQ